MFPDVSSIFGIFSTSPRSRCPRLLFPLICLSLLFTIQNFYPTSILHLGHLNNRPLTTRATMSYGLSRSHASLLSGRAAKFRTVIAVPATLEPAASPPFPFFPALPSNAILVVDPTQIDDRLCRFAIVHRPTINPHG